MKRAGRIILLVLGGLLGLCLMASAISALSNRSLLAQVDRQAATPDSLDALDKARLAEALHLKSTLGDQVWPGWGRAEIPVILWTAGVEFLTGVGDHPPTGSAAVSPGGAGWQPVAGDDFAGQPYYRRSSNEPVNFVVQVGDRWVASMATKSESDRFLIAQFRTMLPGLLEAIFPYRALILASEVQMTGVLHETFHAYQADVAGARLEAAERAHDLGHDYWATDAAMREAWEEEVDLLIRALQAKSEGETRTLAGQFLARRAQRRQAANLPADLADYERQLEWEEGLAKYVELAIWRQASLTADYQSLPAMASDPLFKSYRTFEQRFRQELSSMRRTAGREGETRFYYTGMAQAMLLDNLAPGWQRRAFDADAWLEDLLAAVAVSDD